MKTHFLLVRQNVMMTEVSVETSAKVVAIKQTKISYL